MAATPYTLDGLDIDPDRGARTFDAFDATADRTPEAIALHYLGERYGYGRLRRWSERFASGLARLGVGHQDRVALYLGNTPQWVIANLAVQRLGAVSVPLSPIYTPHELRQLLRDSGAHTIVAQDTHCGYVLEVLADTPLRQVVVTSFVDLLPRWKRWAGRLLDRVPHGRVARRAEVHRFGELLRNELPRVGPARIDPWRDLATLLYTGGTTGAPKGVPGNHATEVGYVSDLVEHVLAPQLRPGRECWLLSSPLYHIMARGLLAGGGFALGNATVLLPLPQMDALLHAIERHRVGWMLGVPALYRMALDCDRIDDYRLDSLRGCFSGGDVLPQEIHRRWRERTGVSIAQVYGATEIGHLAYGSPEDARDPAVIGRPLPSYGCRIVDPETLAAVPPGEAGELLVTAPFTLKSYWRRADESARSFVELDGATYYRMGDLMRLDDAGRLRFVERTADVIKHKGYRVSASEVEAALQDHPTVTGACVVGLPDPAVGERVHAVVVLREDARGASAVELRRWCRERLAPYKVPASVEFRDVLPRSKVGKLLRRELRRRYTRPV